MALNELLTREMNPAHEQALAFVKSWASGTEKLQDLMRRDFEFVNGHPYTNKNELKVSSTGRELLSFNEIRPQFELLSGHRASQELDYVTAPQGREDKRLSAIASTLLKAVYEVANKSQVIRHVGDDGDIGGLGAVYFGHTFDDAEDVVWGDLFLERVSPFSFLWDVWGTPPHYQDGKFMGHRWWMHEEAYRKAYPKASATPPASDWFGTLMQMFGSAETFEPPDALIREFINNDKKHVSVFRVYYRVPLTLYFVADKETGDIYEGGVTREAAEKAKATQLEVVVEQKLGTLTILPQNLDNTQVGFLIVNQEGAPVADDATQAPRVFDTQEAAQDWIDATRADVRGLLADSWKIWKRKRTRLKWVEFNAFEILDEGELPVYTHDFPYAMYVSRQLGDEIEDIEGVVRQIIDRQKEIAKRYNHLADHLAHSAHSGFFNKKGEGADPTQLALMGPRPGIVAEYKTVMPTKIDPSAIPVGHFTLLEGNVAGIQRSTGINSELLGLTSTSTVSGEAIEARQRGGATMLLGRLKNYEDFEKKLAQAMLKQIQWHMPVEKMRRILGVWEAKTQTDILGQSLFLHPITGQPSTEQELLDLLATMKTTRFDLTLRATPPAVSVRQAQYVKGLELARLITETGRPIGPATFKELAQLSDLPERLIGSLEADAQAAQQAQAAAAQEAALGDTLKANQAREGPRGF